MKKILYIVFTLAFSQFVNASRPADYSNPALSADSIVIFVPSKDQALATGNTEQILEGRIAKVEKGVEPKLIVMTAGTLFFDSLQVGVPVRMYLVRLPGRDAYYPIYKPSLSAKEIMTSPPIISIGVTSEEGSASFNVVTGAPLPTTYSLTYSFDATLSFPGALWSSPVKGDVYFGVIPPGKDRSLTWGADGGAQSLKEGLTPIARGIEMTQNSTFNVSTTLGRSIQYTFKSTEPAGMYLVFALLVVSGPDPAVTQNWIGINMTPLFLRSYLPCGALIIENGVTCME